MHKTITVGNVRQKFNDQWVDWKPGDTLVPNAKGGYSLKVGHKGDTWENYYINDAKLFDYFVKGATVAIEYTVTKTGFNVVKGVAPQAAAPSAGGGANKDRAIRLQTYAKAWGQVHQGNHSMTPAVFAADVLAIDEAIEAGVSGPGGDLAKLVEEAGDKLGAEVVPDSGDDDIPFD